MESFLFEQELDKDTLFRNLIRVASYACILTLIVQLFIPLGDTYMYTLTVLVTCILSLLLHAYGKAQEAYHFLVLSVSLGFTIIALVIEKLYPSTLNLYTLGIVFVIAFIHNNSYAFRYLIYFSGLQCYLSYSFLNTIHKDFTWYEFSYDLIHIVAYNMAVFLISMYFIKFIKLQDDKMAILESENSRLEPNDPPMLSKFDSLSTREKEVALLIGEGFANKQIADQLYISIETVKTHRKKIKSKLEIKSNKDFFMYAFYYRN